MADNTTLDPGALGDAIVTREITHAGDPAKLQGVFAMGISGNEGSYTAAAIGGDATNGLDVDVTRVSGTVTVDGSGVTQPVSGTVAVTNGGLTELAAAINGSSQMDVNIAASTATLTVASHAVTNAGTFAVQATVAAAATSIGKAEDAQHASGDVGVPALTVRQDTAAALSGTDADYQPLITDASGRLHVNVGNTVTVGSHAVTNAGTFATQVDGAALTSLQLIDDAVFAEDVAAQAADKGIAILAVRRDADTSLVGTDNDYANLQVNAAGSLKVAITAGAGSGGTSIADGASFTRDTTSVTLAAAAVESSAPTLTNGDAAALSMTTGGALRVAVASGGVAGVVEDAASAGGEEGIMVLAVRRDAASSGVGTDGDFAALSVTSDGSLRVSGGGGGTQFAEDAAHVSADVGTVALAVRRDSAAVGSGTDGDYSTINVDATGRLWCNVSNTVTVTGAGGTFPVTDSGGSLTVDNGGTFAVQATLAAGAAAIAKAEDVASADADVGVPAMAVRKATPANTSGTDGDYEMLQMSAGRLWVDPSGVTLTVASHAVTNAGTFAVQNTAQASTATQEMVGDAADDAAAAGNPLLVAGFSIQTDGTDPGAVSAEADVATLRTDMQRNLLVNITHPRLFNVSADYASAQTNTSVQATPGASLSLYITDLIISNGATAGNITLLDGSGGTVKFEIYPAINGGVAHSFRNPIRLTANTALCITSTTVTTHSVNVSGYIAP